MSKKKEEARPKEFDRWDYIIDHYENYPWEVCGYKGKSICLPYPNHPETYFRLCTFTTARMAEHIVAAHNAYVAGRRKGAK